MTDGMLHLGSMAVLVGAVFLGLDKVSAVASDLSERLDELKPYVKGGLKSLERPHKKIIDGGEAVLDPVYDTFGAYFLLWFAEYDTALYGAWKKCGHFFHRRMRAPFIRGFRRGWHRIPVGLLTALSIFAFLYCIYVEMIDVPPVLFGLPIKPEMQMFFWLFTITILWTFITAYISHRLYTLRRVCTKYLIQTQKRNSASKAGTASKAVDEAYEEVVGPNAVATPPVDDESRD
jgi:hypothetical protein